MVFHTLLYFSFLIGRGDCKAGVFLLNTNENGNKLESGSNAAKSKDDKNDDWDNYEGDVISIDDIKREDYSNITANDYSEDFSKNCKPACKDEAKCGSLKGKWSC